MTYDPDNRRRVRDDNSGAWIIGIIVLVAISWLRGRAGSPAPASLGLAFVPDR